MFRMSHERDGAHAWYVAGLMAVAYAVAFVDRQVLNLLVDPIRHDLGLTDTSISLLQGFAFVAAYVLAGPVFGRLADRGSRRNLLIAGVVLWCTFTVLCGFARDFWTLFIARAGVGAAEACLLPAGWSLLADHFSREKLPRAMSIFLLGPFVGGGLALVFGGLIVRAVTGVEFSGPLAGLPPWGLTFIFVGLPGFLIAAMLLTVREPPRHFARPAEDRSFTVGDVGRFLWSERQFYGRFFGGIALMAVALYALPAWTPTLLMRVHGADPAHVGVEYGIATLIAGSAGILLGPWLAKRLRPRYGEEAPLRTALVAAGGVVPVCLFLPFAPGYWSALVAAALGSLSVNLALPMVSSALQASTPNRMRGLVTSAYAFVVLSMGMGVAPTVIALITDYVLGDGRQLGTSLALVCGTCACASVPLLASAARRYGPRLAAVQQADDGPGA
jgi:MFS family permease